MERKFVNGEHWYLIRDINDPGLPHKFEISSSTSSDWSPWYIHDKWDDMEKWLLSRGYTGDFTYQPGTVHIRPAAYVPGMVNHIKDIHNRYSKILSSAGPNQRKTFSNSLWVTNEPTLAGCQHEWATYTGFIKVETYCTKCKEVRNEN